MKIIISTSTVNEVNDIVAPAYTDLANKVGVTEFKAEFLKREIDVFKYWNISKQDGNTVLEINDELILTLAKYFAVAAEFAGGMYAMALALGLNTAIKKGFGLMDRLTGMLKAKKASSTVKEESPTKPMAEAKSIHAAVVKANGLVEDPSSFNTGGTRLAAVAVLTSQGRTSVIGFRQSEVSSEEYAIRFCSIRSRCGSLVIDAPVAVLLPWMFCKADSLQAVIDNFNLYNQTDGPGDTRIEGLITFN